MQACKNPSHDGPSWLDGVSVARDQTAREDGGRTRVPKAWARDSSRSGRQRPHNDGTPISGPARVVTTAAAQIAAKSEGYERRG